MAADDLVARLEHAHRELCRAFGQGDSIMGQAAGRILQLEREIAKLTGMLHDPQLWLGEWPA